MSNYTSKRAHEVTEAKLNSLAAYSAAFQEVHLATEEDQDVDWRESQNLNNLEVPMNDYSPVSCDLQAHLEEISTRKCQCRITYRGQLDKLSQVCGQIVDIYAVNGADWCKLDNGQLICLDLIEAFES